MRDDRCGKIMDVVGMSCVRRTVSRLRWLKIRAGDVGQQKAVNILMEMIAVCAQMFCWPLHTEDRPEEEAETN